MYTWSMHNALSSIIRGRRRRSTGEVNGVFDALDLDLDHLQNGFDLEQNDMYSTSSDTVLHLGVKLGHQGLVARIIAENSQLVPELNRDGYTALHVACWSGNMGIVRQFIESNPSVCLVVDKFGRTPLHAAAMKGRVDVVRELLSAYPDSIMKVTATDETPFHSAVRHDQEKILELFLVTFSGKNYFGDLINRKDAGGNTLLHLATSRKLLQILKLLLGDNSIYSAKIEVNATNAGGFTALDILDVLPRAKGDVEIEKILRRAGALRAKDLLKGPMVTQYNPTTTRHMNHALLVAATLLAGVSFLSALNFAGRFDETHKYRSARIVALLIGKQNSYLISYFIFMNSISFFASIAMIIMLMHELPLKPWMLISVFSMLGAYICSIMAFSPPDALPVLLLGCPILLGVLLKHVALQSTLFKLF